MITRLGSRVCRAVFRIESRLLLRTMSIADPQHRKFTLVKICRDGMPGRIIAYQRGRRVYRWTLEEVRTMGYAIAMGPKSDMLIKTPIDK